MAEVLGQQRDVVAPGAQRRHGDDLEAQAVEQVGAERAVGRGGRQVDVGRADDADIDGQGLVAADPFELAVFDDAQHLLLHRGAGVGDLVEEQGTAVGQLETGRAAA